MHKCSCMSPTNLESFPRRLVSDIRWKTCTEILSQGYYLFQNHHRHHHFHCHTSQDTPHLRSCPVEGIKNTKRRVLEQIGYSSPNSKRNGRHMSKAVKIDLRFCFRLLCLNIVKKIRFQMAIVIRAVNFINIIFTVVCLKIRFISFIL